MITGVIGLGFTVIVIVAWHPLISVYVMITVPADTPVTTPPLFTVAIVVLEELHGLGEAGVPEPVNTIVNPTHTLVVPVIVGSGFTTNVLAQVL